MLLNKKMNPAVQYLKLNCIYVLHKNLIKARSIPQIN